MKTPPPLNYYEVQEHQKQNDTTESKVCLCDACEVVTSMHKGTKDEYNNEVKEEISNEDSIVTNIVLYNVEGYLYRDCYTADVATVQHFFSLALDSKRKGPRGGVAVPFPVRLYEMLNSTFDNENLRSIISWQPHGRCFRIHHIQRFTDEIMPR